MVFAGRLCWDVFFHKTEDKDVLTEPLSLSVSCPCAQLDVSISVTSSRGWVCTSTFFGGM